MNRILFGHHGRYGDIMMGIPTIKYLKEQHPNDKYFININKNYQDCAPLFYNNESIDGIFISSEYQNFPDKLDRENLNYCNFHTIFNPMMSRKDEHNWFTKRHQVSDIAYNYQILNENECHKVRKIKLNKWFDIPDFSNCIAFHATPSNYDKNNKKSFTRQKSQELVNELLKLGPVLQVGSVSDEKLEGVYKIDTDYFNSTKNILGCKLFVGFDSGITWTLSGYDAPVLAFYSNEYYGKEFIKNIQPVNSNAIYLDDTNVNDIPNELIIENIRKLL